MLIIREFVYPDDYASAAHLWQTAGPGIHYGESDEPSEIQKKLQRDPDLFLVAEVNGQLVGTIIGGFDGRRGMIYHLAVEAHHRKEGIGSLLMKEVEKRLIEKGCLKCYLMVASDNADAIHFYEMSGWVRMEEININTYRKELKSSARVK
jgi:ribosomal protein S18 acetylase RimI-like enzyme